MVLTFNMKEICQKNQIFELQRMKKVWVTQDSQKKCECLVKPKLLL